MKTPLLERNTSIVRGCKFHESCICWKTGLGMDRVSLPGRNRGKDIALMCQRLRVSSSLMLSLFVFRSCSSIWSTWILSSDMRTGLSKSFGFKESEPFKILRLCGRVIERSTHLARFSS